MVGVEGLLVDLDGTLEQASGGGEVALVLHHEGEVGVASRERGVVGVEGLLADLDGALEQASGGGEVAQVLHHEGEVGVAPCQVGVVGVEGLLLDLDGALEQAPGLDELAELPHRLLNPVGEGPRTHILIEPEPRHGLRERSQLPARLALDPAVVVEVLRSVQHHPIHRRVCLVHLGAEAGADDLADEAVHPGDAGVVGGGEQAEAVEAVLEGEPRVGVALDVLRDQAGVGLGRERPQPRPDDGVGREDGGEPEHGRLRLGEEVEGGGEERGQARLGVQGEFQSGRGAGAVEAGKALLAEAVAVAGVAHAPMPVLPQVDRHHFERQRVAAESGHDVACGLAGGVRVRLVVERPVLVEERERVLVGQRPHLLAGRVVEVQLRRGAPGGGEHMDAGGGEGAGDLVGGQQGRVRDVVEHDERLPLGREGGVDLAERHVGLAALLGRELDAEAGRQREDGGLEVGLAFGRDEVASAGVVGGVGPGVLEGEGALAHPAEALRRHERPDARVEEAVAQFLEVHRAADEVLARAGDGGARAQHPLAVLDEHRQLLADLLDEAGGLVAVPHGRAEAPQAAHVGDPLAAGEVLHPGAVHLRRVEGEAGDLDGVQVEDGAVAVGQLALALGEQLPLGTAEVAREVGGREDDEHGLGLADLLVDPVPPVVARVDVAAVVEHDGRAGLEVELERLDALDEVADGSELVVVGVGVGDEEVRLGLAGWRGRGDGAEVGAVLGGDPVEDQPAADVGGQRLVAVAEGAEGVGGERPVGAEVAEGCGAGVLGGHGASGGRMV